MERRGGATFGRHGDRGRAFRSRGVAARRRRTVIATSGTTSAWRRSTAPASLASRALASGSAVAALCYARLPCVLASPMRRPLPEEGAMRPQRKLGLVAILLAVAPPASAEWRSFHADDGLAGNEVHSIAAARDGAIWFGCELGAVRADGLHWSRVLDRV